MVSRSKSKTRKTVDKIKIKRLLSTNFMKLTQTKWCSNPYLWVKAQKALATGYHHLTQILLQIWHLVLLIWASQPSQPLKRVKLQVPNISSFKRLSRYRLTSGRPKNESPRQQPPSSRTFRLGKKLRLSKKETILRNCNRRTILISKRSALSAPRIRKSKISWQRNKKKRHEENRRSSKRRSKRCEWRNLYSVYTVARSKDWT